MNKPKTSEEMLDILRQFLNDEQLPVRQRTDLWDVLSALRGPDSGHITSSLAQLETLKAQYSVVDDWAARRELKTVFTEVIRSRILRPDSFLSYARADTNPDDEDRVAFRKMLGTMTGRPHFIAHAEEAFKSLGLSLEELNKNYDWDAFDARMSPKLEDDE